MRPLTIPTLRRRIPDEALDALQARNATLAAANDRLRTELDHTVAALAQQCDCTAARIQRAHAAHQAAHLDPDLPAGGLTTLAESCSEKPLRARA